MTANSPATIPFAKTANRYLVESRQPLASLVFIVPLLAIYEAGVVVLGPHAVPNGADTWLRRGLEQLGFGQYFLLPALTVSTLLAWHHLTRHPWRVSAGTLYGMTGECVLLAICLRFLLQLQNVLRESMAAAVRLDVAASLWPVSGYIGTLTSYFGAGIYEELLFRLLMLPFVAWVLRQFRLTPTMSMAGAVLVTSLLFAVAHHVGPYGEPFAWFNFLFRLLAGMFFAVLFVYRGFGIAAGAHAGYDILVGLSRL
jgi:membrane protease YdiL (CAAX protease family)